MGFVEIRLDALILRASESAAQVVPRETAQELVRAAAGRWPPIHHTPLVVLRQGAGGLLEDGGGWKAPALNAARLLEVLQETRLVGGAVGERAHDVGNVVLEFREVGAGGNLRRLESRLDRVRACWCGKGRRHDHQGEQACEGFHPDRS